MDVGVRKRFAADAWGKENKKSRASYAKVRAEALDQNMGSYDAESSAAKENGIKRRASDAEKASRGSRPQYGQL